MKKFVIIYCSFLFVAFTTTASAIDFPDFTVLVEKNKSSVVNISVKAKSSAKNSSDVEEFNIPQPENQQQFEDLLKRFFHEFGGQNQQQGFKKNAGSLGSGFIISADGYIVTNHHVISDASEIYVKLSDRREFEAKLIGSDKRSDIALIKIDATHLPVVTLGSSTLLKQGEWVLAIGSPFGLDHSVSAGIVSAKGRSLPGENYVPYIQTDVAINPGNSGGPLFNMKGEVVGVNSQIYSRSGGYMGLSFSIPVELMLKVVDQIKDKGEVTRGWLGVIIQEVTSDLARSFSMAIPRGALVAQVLENSPAEKSELQTGDIILEFDGFPISKSSDLPPVVGTSFIGSTSQVLILREGKEMEIAVVIEELPDDAGTAKTQMVADEVEGLGMKLIPLSEKEKGTRDLLNGLRVTEVKEGPAEKAGITVGDIILSINNRTLDSIVSFTDAIDNLPENRPSAILLKRNGRSLFMTIDPDS